MKRSSKTGLFPWAILLAGILGFALRSWLFSAEDSRGLLPQGHVGAVVPFILLAVTMALCFYGARLVSSAAYVQLFPASGGAALFCLAGAVGMGFAGFTAAGTGVLKLLTVIFGILTAVALGLAAVSRHKGARPNCLLFCVATVYCLIRTLVFCRAWGAEPQLLRFFFELLACLLLMMVFYYRAQLTLNGKGVQQYFFMNHAALFCCCLCLAGEDFLFYLSAGIFLAADACALSPTHTND